MQKNSPSWTVAIFTARETIATLTGCIRAALESCEGSVVIVDVLVNGNRTLAEAAAHLVAHTLSDLERHTIRVWFIPLGDKAHAWNEYIHRIWLHSEITYFIDGYVKVRSNSFSLIANGLNAKPLAIGASGVPTSGRSATTLRETMLKGGGIHGNLYAIRGSTVALMRNSNFRLPIGLYRTDSLIGAMLMFRLDPTKNKWDVTSIFVHPHATWDVENLGLWTIEGLITQWKRKVRQAQGDLENRATREHLSINRLPFETMPSTIKEFVNKWIVAQRKQAIWLFIRRPLSLYAMRKLEQRRDWSSAEIHPELLKTDRVEKALVAI